MNKWYKCKVRNGFVVHLRSGGVHLPGNELSLTFDQYELHSHQVDLLEIIDPTQSVPSPAPKTPVKSKEVKPSDAT